MHEKEEIKLIHDVKKGNKASYAKLINHYENDIRRIIVFALYNQEATEDLIQQTFVNAWFMFDTFDESKMFGPWIKTIAHNLVKNEMRSLSRRQKHLANYREYLFTTMEEKNNLKNETEDELALSLCKEKLSKISIKALKLRYEDGLSFDIIAKKLDRTIAGSRQLLTRVRVQLKDCIQLQTNKRTDS